MNQAELILNKGRVSQAAHKAREHIARGDYESVRSARDAAAQDGEEDVVEAIDRVLLEPGRPAWRGFVTGVAVAMFVGGFYASVTLGHLWGNILAGLGAMLALINLFGGTMVLTERRK